MNVKGRVLKNTGVLYLKMGITMFISLYSTRVILNALGSEDFGIFSIVGGMIAMFGFLNASMASASQRFMSYAEGEGSTEQKKQIFNVSMLLHIFIALLVFVILEFMGWFFFESILQIPLNRLESAKIVYQFMVFSAVITVLTVPYNAVLNTHENMLLFSVIDIIQSILKLFAALFIVYTLQDKLEVYSGLIALVTLFVFVLYALYCHKKYIECEINFKKYVVKSKMKEMSSFAGWNFFGYATGMTGMYGQGVLLNMFFGTILNAAQGIANQISGQLMSFSNTMLKALKPIIDKSEGAGDRQRMLKASMVGSKLSFFLFAFFVIPFLIEIQFILKLWIINFPVWTVVFCRLLLLKGLIDQLTVTLGSAIGAEGRIKFFNILISLNNVLPLPIIYFLFKNGSPPYVMYLVGILFFSIGNGLIHLYFVNKNCSLSIRDFLNIVFYKCISVFALTTFLSIIPFFFLEEGIIRLLITIIVSSISFLILVYSIGLNQEEKYFFNSLMIKGLNIIKGKYNAF